MSIYLFSVAAFCACATLAVIEHAGQIPGALSGESLTNLSMYAIQQLDARDLLLERQSTCYSPNIYCPVGGYCCYAEQNCCPGGCAPADASTCCGSTGYCHTGFGCCQQQSCTPLDAECCSDGGYCPDPFMCVKVLETGQIGCCTDLSCSVYLSSSQTVTYTPSTRAAATTTRAVATTTEYTGYDYTQTDYDYTETDYYSSYRTWSTTYYLYYFYYYYTVSYSPSTFTTRESTSVDRTTTVRFAGTESYDASSYFSSCSREYTTPSEANNYLPVTPTAGALIVGSCSSTSTMEDGFVTSSCETMTAGSSSGTRASSGSVSTGSSSNSEGFSSGSRTVRSDMPWLPITLMSLGMLSGALMVVL